MLVGLNLNEGTTNMNFNNVEALAVPAHLSENFEAISALGNVAVEKIYEGVIEAEANLMARIQEGVSKGTLSESYGEIIQEGALGNFFKKIRELFNKLVAAVKALFAKFIAWLDAKFMDDKKFVEKYRKMLLAKANKVGNMDYKAHDWKLTKIVLDNIWAKLDECFKDELGLYVVKEIAKEKAKADGGVKAIGYNPNSGSSNRGGAIPMPNGQRRIGYDRNSDIEDAEIIDNENYVESAVYLLEATEERDMEKVKEDYIKKIAGAVGLNESEADDFKKAFAEEISGGSIEEMTGPNLKEMLDVVEGYAKEKGAIEKAERIAQKSYGTAIKSLEKAEKAAKDNVGVSTAISKAISLCKELATLGNGITSIYLTAIKTRRTEYKAVLGMAVSYKQKD